MYAYTCYHITAHELLDKCVNQPTSDEDAFDEITTYDYKVVMAIKVNQLRMQRYLSLPPIL